MTTLSVRTTQTDDLVDITERVREAIPAGLDGAVVLYCPHTTAGLLVNEGADPDVAMDLLAALRRLVPRDGPYRHREGNAAAHIRSVLTGSSLLIPVQAGRLALGVWQRIFLAEYDGPRNREVLIQFLGPG